MYMPHIYSNTYLQICMYRRTQSWKKPPTKHSLHLPCAHTCQALQVNTRSRSPKSVPHLSSPSETPKQGQQVQWAKHKICMQEAWGTTRASKLCQNDPQQS